MRLRSLLVTIFLMLSGTAWADGCSESQISNPRHPCSHWLSKDYSIALETIRAADVQSEHRGQGTTVVQIENYIPWLEAADAETSRPLFGDCELASRQQNAEQGYAPKGDSCRVKWVQCFNFSEFGERQCNFSPGPRQTHATNVAQGILAVAPETNLITLKLEPFDGRNYSAAVDWLLSKSPQFNNKSPAEYWNVVAVSGSYGLLSGRAPGDRDIKVRALFADFCELENPDPGSEAKPEKYIADWMMAHAGKVRLGGVTGFQTHSKKLLDAGIVPVFGAYNNLAKSEQMVNGKKQIAKFISPNGVAFPGCLRDTFAVSAIAPDYYKRTNKWIYIASNSHQDVTQLVAPGGAGSYSVPLVSGAIAVLKSASLSPGSSPAELANFLKSSEIPPAEAGISCIPVQDEFPPGEALALGCEGNELPYTLPVLDLKAASEAASE